MKNQIIEYIGKKIWQSAEIDADKLEFFDYVRDACKANYCGIYNKTWMCPPGVGEIADLMAKCRNYKTAFVFTTKSYLEDSFDIEGMTTARELHEALNTVLIDNLDHSKCMILGAGGCNRCNKCTYPDSPCRQPDKAIPSVEACGIDVMKLSKTCGINYINGENTVTYFSVVLYDRVN